MPAAKLKPVSLASVSSRYTGDRRDARNIGLAEPVPSLNIRTRVAAVSDPLEPGSRLLARVNVHVDVLEAELGHKRISEAAYQEGRRIQRVFEATSRLGSSASSWNGSGRRNPADTHELSIGYGVENAREALELQDELKRQVGEMGVRFLRPILGEGRSFAQIAGQLASERAIGKVADRFRVYLEELAEARSTAHGARRPAPRDKYAQQAREVEGR